MPNPVDKMVQRFQQEFSGKILTLSELIELAEKENLSLSQMVVAEAMAKEGKTYREILSGVTDAFKHNLKALEVGLTQSRSFLLGTVGFDLARYNGRPLIDDSLINRALIYTLATEVGNHEIGRKVSQSAVLSADETGWRLNGITHWLWCFVTSMLCYYVIVKSRASPVVRDVLGRFFKGILICDFWGAYNKISALAKQRCFYHLFTELVKVDQLNTSSGWKAFRKKLSRLLKDAIRLSERQDRLPLETYHRLKQRVYNRLDQFLATPYQDRDAKRLLKRLKRHRHELFTFLEYQGVSPYNHHAEQQMRNPVLTRKVSQQNRSEEGVKTQLILMTLFRSAQLQGHNPVETVLSIAKMALGARSPDALLNCQLILFSKS